MLKLSKMPADGDSPDFRDAISSISVVSFSSSSLLAFSVEATYAVDSSGFAKLRSKVPNTGLEK